MEFKSKEEGIYGFEFSARKRFVLRVPARLAFIGQVTEVQLSYYLVLLSVDSKTR